MAVCKVDLDLVTSNDLNEIKKTINLLTDDMYLDGKYMSIREAVEYVQDQVETLNSELRVYISELYAQIE